MNTIFFSLIDILCHHPSTEEWGELYRMAAKQLLVGVCFAGVRRYMETAQQRDEKKNISQKLYYQWQGVAVRIQ